MYVSRYFNDPRFYGTYSSRKIGAFLEDPEQLNLFHMPVSSSRHRSSHPGENDEKDSEMPTLYITGEAFDDNFYGTTHGAYFAG